MPPAGESTLRKIGWRLLPFLTLLYFVAILDRVNVGFAKLTMNSALGFDDSVFSFGAGIFFLGYFFFGVPSNLALARVGARRWIALILICWGVISAAMASVTGATGFYALRFTLGLAESGFFPGIILYLTYWFPADYRARVIGLFMAAVPLSNALGSPVSSELLTVDGLFGLSGWQLLFVLEGVPAVLLGLVCLAWLPDRPQDAAFLEADEKAWLSGILAEERRRREAIRAYSLGQALANPLVWVLALIYFCNVLANYGLGFWLPSLIRGLGVSLAGTGWVALVPYACGTIAMILWSRHSDRTGERVWHLTAAFAMGFTGFIAAGQVASPVAQIAAISLAAIGINCVVPVFWTFPTALLTGTAAAGGIAFINALANLAGYFGPVIVNGIKGSGDDFGPALAALGGAMLLGGAVALAVGKLAGREAPASPG